jgi:Spy/CpxP family protein refolding chaperone
MKNRIAIIVAMLCMSMLACVAVHAQQAQPPRRPTPPAPRAPQPPPPQPNVPPTAPVPPLPPMDPLGEAMFPPDLIMRHARELGLTDEQKTFMRSEIQRTTTRFNELQWQLQDAVEMLAETMKTTSVNEQQALALLDKVLDTEREIKRLHISMGIRIKNKLTPEQQAKLHAMRNPPRADGPPPRFNGPGRPDRRPETDGGPGS